MAKLTGRSLRVRWIRFLLTSLAVILGVAFVTGSFVVSDSLRKVFDTIAADAFNDVDVAVRGVDPLAQSDAAAASRQPVPASLVEDVRAVDGVAEAEGFAQAFVSVTAPDGRTLDPGGGPVIGFTWSGPEESGAGFQLEEGRAPTGPGEVAIDRGSAATYDIAVGDTVSVRAAGGSGDFTVTAITRFGQSGAGFYYVLFEPPTAQRLFGLGEQFQTISVTAASGINQAELRDRVAEVLPTGYEAVTGQQAGQEFSDSFGQIIDIFRNALLAFAVVTLFVAGFLINTVFNTTVGQRVRELALLRAIGARNIQVTRSVLTESFVIGLFSSIVGAVAGIGVAALIKGLVSGTGGGLPDGPLVLSATTWIVAFVVGVGITMAVSLVPAWRAGRVSPVAAMRDGWSMRSDRIAVRLVAGIAAAVVGTAAFLNGLFGDPPSTAARLFSLGSGAVLIFLGVSALSPLFARPVAMALGWPVRRLFGVTGRLAQGNAARNPRRTASTASALMIGVALVSMVGVIGASFNQSFGEQLDRGITADYFLTVETFYGFSPELASELAALPVVDDVATFRQGQVRVDGGTKQVVATQGQGLDRVLNLGVSAGSAATIPADGLLLHRDAARDLGVGVGDTVPMLFPVGGERELQVVGIYDDNIGGIGNWIISQQAFEAGFPPDTQLDLFGGFTLAAGADPAAAQAEVQAVAARYPEVTLEDRAEFKAAQQGQINALQTAVNGLLGFSLVVAVLGIAITLALAVFERTRELGLLRAVGQQRRQTRRMVRFEAAIVAVLGAALGIGLGVLFGLAITSALPSSIITVIALPWGQLVGTLVAAALAGVIAALLPAWRAGRLKVLDAIAYE